MSTRNSCPCPTGDVAVTTGTSPFLRKSKSVCLLLSFAFVFSVMLFANASSAFAQVGACAGSASITMLPSTGTSCGTALVAGQQKTINVILNNNSTDASGLVPVPAKLTGTTTITLACTDTGCTTQLPGTLVFVPGPADGCASHVPGVLSCTSIDANHVAINMTAEGVPLNPGPNNIATITVQAGTFVNSVCGVFGERADTGVSDVTTTADPGVCTPQANAGAQGSNSEFFPQCVTVEDCTPSENPCQTAVCTNNTCGTTNVEDSTPCGSDETPGDCKTPGCEAGVCVQTHNNVSDSTPCTTTPDVPGDCRTPGCEGGVCVATHNSEADSTPCTSTPDVPGDCRTPGCEGGACVATHNSEADSTPCTSTPDVPGDCKTPGCEGGTCVAAHINEADSTPCTTATDIAGDCKTPGCEGGTCVATHTNEADSTPCTDDPAICGIAGCEGGSCVQTHTPEQCGGNEGCTPGFWKANADKKLANAWPVDPNTKLGTVFTIPPCLSGCDIDFANLTLREALSLQGGDSLCEKAEILLRIATGAYLNSLSSCVSFPISTGALVAEVNDVLDDCDGSAYTTESTKLDGFNNLGCPLNQQGQCSHAVDTTLQKSSIIAPKP